MITLLRPLRFFFCALLSLPPLCQELAAQGRPQLSNLQKDLMEYVGNGVAVPACGVCFEAAGRYAERKKAAALAEKTRGMSLVKAGVYWIGAEPGKGQADEFPRHAVRLDAFYIDNREATMGEYQAFVKETGAHHPEWSKPGGKFNIETGREKYYRRLESFIKNCRPCPVFGVLWEDAAAYCLAKKKRLPTEAEWEAAAADGKAYKFGFGESDSDYGKYGWYEENSGGVPHPVGAKTPGRYGLYDMHGNVWEWTSDFYERGYYARAEQSNPKGPAAGKEHVIRGGSWDSGSDAGAVTNRGSYDKANDDIGFRCVLPASETEQGAAAGD
ncbi:MAG: hypothetical protein A2X35_01710 [Elusimicrobia bacterium GWA2_61_42]|nr:MAG: hypothetical protein A2X35_01710 [Elusimicrobia bacterium GWA2_61_42]OGR76862.1 MAG: hypothetical protein A2X38_11885 [Elusimicrobia bacterium GWC2_61_25]